MNVTRATTRTILGFLDRIEADHVAGWALDPINPREPLIMRVIIDGHVVDTMTCNIDRQDVATLNLPSNKVGFEYAIQRRFQDGRRHVLSFETVGGAPIRLPGRGGIILPELHFCLQNPSHVEGVLDGVVDGLIQGWVLRVDTKAGTRTGGVRILVSTQGQPIVELTADQFRPDVADALGADPACGFAFTPPPEFRHGRLITFDFQAMPECVPLRGSPLEVALPTDAERARIQRLIDRADELFVYAYHLRRELRAALPAQRYMINDYPRWEKLNRPLILPRSIARYGDIKPDAHGNLPLVSVLCPVYRPAQGAFLAAVDSVRAQTYENWELILVDDGSHQPALTAVMKSLAESDPRIKLFIQKANAGISEATNRAIAEAKGSFIAFFDHDDVLAPFALDVMLRAQSATGARLLYSDEDKIDRTGGLSEPNFKPDFNYRFLLELNYICHLVLADSHLIRDVGGLDALFDGAQDHDMLLRLAERLKPHEIHHVPEILYHWRVSESSTAGGGAAKPYAANAGEAAVAAHLQRRNIPATVEKRGDLTCYRIDFGFQEDPGVSILIPFRDHVDMTRLCVEAIRKHTKGLKYEILLLDNWSKSAEAEAFCTEQGNIPNTQVLRIVEPFNYSRINNLGAAAARHPFLLFMNNDVIVDDPDWLRILLDEALADPAVAAVGAKLLYPNGTVQHAGVVLGVGGIADHAFRGLHGEAPGYIAHAIAAREVAAVTAACMLCRRSAFDEVGGFDEAELTVAFNDVDLCMKLTAAGHRIIFTPDCLAEHRESMSRGDDLDETKLARFMRENEAMRNRWSALLPHDPFYSRHFSRDGGVYTELRLLDPADEQPIVPVLPSVHPIAPVLQPIEAPRRGQKPVASVHAAKVPSKPTSKPATDQKKKPNKSKS
jgi:GT2 family glycosyltransferase